MRTLLLFALLVSACLPLMGCHGGDDGGENKVISSKGGPAPVETPPDPNRPHPHMNASGGGGSK